MKLFSICYWFSDPSGKGAYCVNFHRRRATEIWSVSVVHPNKSATEWDGRNTKANTKPSQARARGFLNSAINLRQTQAKR